MTAGDVVLVKADTARAYSASSIRCIRDCDLYTRIRMRGVLFPKSGVDVAGEPGGPMPILSGGDSIRTVLWIDGTRDAALEQHEAYAEDFVWATGITLALAALVLVIRRPAVGRALASATVVSSLMVAGLGVRVGLSHSRRQPMNVPELPEPEDMITQYDAGQLDQAELNRQICRHLASLYQLKEVDLVVMNCLLRDMAAVAAELNLERPSDELRQRLKDWIRQAQSGRSDAQPPAPAADAEVPSSPVDEV